MANNYYPAKELFRAICAQNRLAQAEKFVFTQFAGLYNFQEVFQGRAASAYFCFDDTTTGRQFERNGGWYHRRTFTVFLLKKYAMGSLSSRAESLDVCRTLFAQVVSKLLHDSERLATEEGFFLNVSDINYHEVADSVMDSYTGLYFMVDADEPINHVYDNEQWT